MKYTLIFSFLLLLLAACASEQSATESKALYQKWVQYDEMMNGQSLLGGNPLLSPLVFEFMDGEKCNMTNAKGVQSGTFEIQAEKILHVKFGDAESSFAIEKISDTELDLLNNNGTTLKFKPSKLVLRIKPKIAK